MRKLTVSAIKADVGGYVGHSDVHPEMLAGADSRVREAVESGLLIDGSVGSCGDDVNLVMTHERGVDSVEIHHFAWDTFLELTEIAKRLHLYGAGQDLLAEAFHDLIEHKRILFRCPEELYDLLAYIGTPSRYVIKHVFRNDDLIEPVAVTSTSRLSLIAGRYVGKDDPIMIVRCQSGLPAVGEMLEPFALPHLVAGWMRGSHNGPLMPCALDQSPPARFDGPPRVVGMGFQIADGRLVGPRDMLGNISFDRARQIALEVADHMRRNGPFEPGRLPAEAMEYTTLPQVEERTADRWEPIEEPATTAPQPA